MRNFTRWGPTDPKLTFNVVLDRTANGPVIIVPGKPGLRPYVSQIRITWGGLQATVRCSARMGAANPFYILGNPLAFDNIGNSTDIFPVPARGGPGDDIFITPTSLPLDGSGEVSVTIRGWWGS